MNHKPLDTKELKEGWSNVQQYPPIIIPPARANTSAEIADLKAKILELETRLVEAEEAYQCYKRNCYNEKQILEKDRKRMDWIEAYAVELGLSLSTYHTISYPTRTLIDKEMEIDPL